MKKDYIIITNNPLVPQMLDEEHEVDYSEISYEDVLGKVRDRIHEGHLQKSTENSCQKHSKTSS